MWPLDRWPTLAGKVLVGEDVLECERTYPYSLGSQRGNTHLHSHIAGLPPGVPYRRQQFHAPMTENGVLSVPPDEAAGLAVRLRVAVVARGGAGAG
jgi:histidine triad (HIT) family protein